MSSRTRSRRPSTRSSRTIYQGTDAVITGEDCLRRQRGVGCRDPVVRRVSAGRGAGAARSRRRRGRRRRRGAADRRRRRRDPVRRRAEHRLLDRSRSGPLQLHRAQAGRLAGRRRRRRGHLHGLEGGHRGRRADRRAGRRACTAPARVRAVRLLFGRQHRRGDAGGLRPAHGAAALRQGRQARPDPGGGGRGHDARRSCSPSIKSVLPPGTQVRTGRRPGRRGRERDAELPQLPPGLPARVRRHRALRRRVRDRQLALDHDRAADTGVRHHAHDRRLASPDHEGRAPRGARHRPGRLRRRHPARPRPRQGPLLALRTGRVHASQQRPPPADPDGDRRADRRRARNRHRQPAARPSSDARASDRRRPRRRGAAARTLRSLPAARLGAARPRPASRCSPTGCSGPASPRRSCSWPWAWAPC